MTESIERRQYSRRKAFRFSCRNFVIQYKTAYDDRTAQLINLSTTGCLLRDTGHQVTVGEKLLLIFPLHQETAPIEANGFAIRVRGHDIAVHFKVIEQDAVNKLRLFIFNRLDGNQ
ncbi:MAG: hypothetical protein CSA33_07665 [Desulfobulbus propionicus]|nr:MAG: hypothetical protein CSA33_07665 [Desulfobulbus propionicus]